MAKILAVDDEPAILEMIESILNKDGHLVTKVSNPLKINMEELHRYDLILPVSYTHLTLPTSDLV